MSCTTILRWEEKLGSLVPNPNDMEAINALNSLFSEPRLTGLRQWMAANDKSLFVRAESCIE